MNEDLELYRFCPRFDKCSVNKCPLDSHYPNRESILTDYERKCGVSKLIRVRIHEEHKGNLKYKGMTQGEYNAKQRWDNLSDQEKHRRIEQGREALQNIRK